MLRLLRSRLRETPAVVAVVVLTAAAACSSGGSSGTGGQTTTSSSGTQTTGSTGSGGTGGTVDIPVCDPPSIDAGVALPTTVDKVSATISMSDAGGPIEGLHVELCGIDKCFTEATNASGAVTVLVNWPVKKPSFKFGDALKFARLSVPVGAGATDLGALVTAPLPATGAPLTPGGTATSGGVTLTLPSPLDITFDLSLGYMSADKQAFRAVALPLDDQEKPVIEPSGLTPGMLYGVSPAETVFCPSVKVTVPNTPGWLAGSAVDFYVLGLDPGEVYVAYGAWQKLSAGHVSADGASVSTDDDGGFPVLESFMVVKGP